MYFGKIQWHFEKSYWKHKQEFEEKLVFTKHTKSGRKHIVGTQKLLKDITNITLILIELVLNPSKGKV